MGGQQEQLALGQCLAVDVRVFGVMQAQAQVAIAQQQALDHLSGAVTEQAARGIGKAPPQGGDALRQQLLDQRRGADDAQRRCLVKAQTIGQALQWLEGVVDPGNRRLQLPGLASGLQASAHAGEQHEPQVAFGIAQQGLDLGHRELQQLGGGAQVGGLQEGLNHFDMT